MQRQKMLNGCLLLTAIAVFLIYGLFKGNELGKRYEQEGVDVVVIVDEYYRIRFNTTYLGSYIYKGNYFSNVTITNAGTLSVGDKVPCKVLLTNPHRAEYAGDDNNIAKYLCYMLVALIVLADAFAIYKYIEYCRILKDGRLATGTVTFVKEEGKEFVATVDFEELNGTRHTVTLNMGKRMLVEGQKIPVKYAVDKYGRAAAYYYDNRR